MLTDFVETAAAKHGIIEATNEMDMTMYLIFILKSKFTCR